MKGAKILLVEDNADLAKVLQLHLSQLGYVLEHAEDGEEGLYRLQQGEYVLVILDVMLPKIDGLEVLKRIRAEDRALPIMMLTSKSEEIDKVVGLNLGADDYVTKPFTVSELLARINALLRRAGPPGRASDQGPEDDLVLRFDPLRIDLQRRRVTIGDQLIEMTPKEFDIVAFLASNPGRPVTREQLIAEVWGYDGGDYQQAVNNVILRVRKKIEADPANPKYLLTVRGMGYRFVEQWELSGEDPQQS